MECSKSSFLGYIDSNKDLSHETRKILNNLTLYLKLEKEKQTQKLVKKENNEDQNGNKQRLNTHKKKKINETTSRFFGEEEHKLTNF